MTPSSGRLSDYEIWTIAANHDSAQSSVGLGPIVIDIDIEMADGLGVFFRLEVCIDRPIGRWWLIDLSP